MKDKFTLDKLITCLKQWLKEKTTGQVKIILHQGGIRSVRLEKEIIE